MSAATAWCRSSSKGLGSEPFAVMPGLVPGIHVFLAAGLQSKTWMAGTSPAMTTH
jgi:hypothetical protein